MGITPASIGRRRSTTCSSQDEAGEELLAATFAHDEAGLRSLCRALVRLKVELVAIERPDGLLVERLLDAGLRVMALHPNQVAAARPRFRACGRQVRPLRRVRALRAGAHRSPSLPGARARQRSDQGAAGADPRARGSRPDPGGAGQPAARRARALLARTDRPVQRPRQPDLARVPGALPEPGRRARPGRAAPRGVPRPPALQRPQAPGRAARQAQTRARGPRRRARMPGAPAASCSRSSRRSSRSSRRSSSSSAQIATRVRAHPDGEIFLSLFHGPDSVITAADAAGRDRRLPRALPHRATRSPATPAKPRSRSSPASARSPASAGRATSACAPRSARSPTAPATGTPGPPTTTPARSPAATTTPARPAPSAAPGAASSGAAGRTAPPMTPPATAACSSTSRSRSPARRAPGPTSPPPSGCSAPPSPTGRTAGPSAKRLTASRHPLPRSGVDTGRLTGRAIAYPDLDGVTAFRPRELRPGWVPSLPRGRWCSPRPSRLLDRHLPLHSGQSFHPLRHPILRGLRFTRHQRGFTQLTRPVFPSPVAARMERAALGLSPGLRTPPTRSRQRTPRWGQAIEHGPGTTGSTSHSSILQSCSSLTTCDLASHDDRRERGQRAAHARLRQRLQQSRLAQSARSQVVHSGCRVLD